MNELLLTGEEIREIQYKEIKKYGEIGETPLPEIYSAIAQAQLDHCKPIIERETAKGIFENIEKLRIELLFDVKGPRLVLDFNGLQALKEKYLK